MYSANDSSVAIYQFLEGLPMAGVTSAVAKPAPSDLVMKIQKGLGNIAYTDIAVDGLIGEKTRTAIRHFEKHYRLPVTGDPASRRTLTDKAKAVLEQELMEFIGPMAAIICEETWGSVSEMEAALEVLGRELPDPGQVARFRQNVLKRLA